MIVKRDKPVQQSRYMIGLARFLRSIMISCAFSCALATVSYGATDDNAFNDCIRRYGDGPDMLSHQVWQTGRVPANITSFLKPVENIENYEKWISEKNKDGSVTIVVLARDKDGFEDEDAPYGFYVFLENEQKTRLLINVGTSAFFFSKQSLNGFHGLLFCWNGNMESTIPIFWDGNELLWNGKKVDLN